VDDHPGGGGPAPDGGGSRGALGGGPARPPHGSVHLELALSELAPGEGSPEARPAGDHFHRFQEAFFFLRGEAVGWFEDEERSGGA
jgi:hypothetical protein